MQDQDSFGRRVVQLRPGQFDLLQLAEALCTEVVNGALVAGFGRVRSKLAVQEPPREGFGSAKGESPVDQPQVEIEAQGGALERLS